jgi:DNA repair protein RadC
MPGRPERLYQLRFDENFKPTGPEDVTPPGFAGWNFTDFTTRQERLGQRLARFVYEVRQPIRVISSAEAARYLQDHIYSPFSEFSQEEMWALLLNTRNDVTHQAMVYRGTVNSVLVRATEILRPAVEVNAVSLILSHCHPSGDPTPSPEDVRVTQQLNQAASLLDLQLLDHIIVGKDHWVSLKERALF